MGKHTTFPIYKKQYEFILQVETDRKANAHDKLAYYSPMPTFISETTFIIHLRMTNKKWLVTGLPFRAKSHQMSIKGRVNI